MKSPLSFYTVLFLLAAICSACFSVKPGTSKSGKNLYESFYVGKEGTQYFIKPMTFERSQGEGRFNMDITFRYDQDLQDTAVLNSSLFSPGIVKEVDTISIANGQHTLTSSSIKKLYVEKRNDLFKIRNSMHCSLAEVDPLFSDSNWTITVHYDDQSIEFIPTGKTRKSIETLDNSVFVIFSE